MWFFSSDKSCPFFCDLLLVLYFVVEVFLTCASCFCVFLSSVICFFEVRSHSFLDSNCCCRQPRWLSGLKRSRVHSVMIARRLLCPAKLRSNPGQGSKGINFSGWHGLDMSVTVTKRRQTPTNQTKLTVAVCNPYTYVQNS